MNEKVPGNISGGIYARAFTSHVNYFKLLLMDPSPDLAQAGATCTGLPFLLLMEVLCTVNEACKGTKT